MSEEEPRRPKLIMPDPESARPKSQLLVAGSDGTPVPVEPAAAEEPVEEVIEEPVAEEGITVINEEETGEPSPVKIQEMAPPPVEEVVEEVVAPADEIAHEQPPVEAVEQVTHQEVAYEQPVEEVAYEQPAEQVAYEQPAEQVAYEQPAEQVAYEQPAYEAPPAGHDPSQPQYAPEAYAQPPAAQAAYAPPPAAGAPYQAPPPAYAAPPVQAAPMGVYGGATLPMVGQPRGVPGWAMLLLGLLGGFLITLALFKFTKLAEGLRPDLIERGRKLVKTAQASSDEPEESEPTPAPTTPPDSGGAPGDAGGGAQPGGGDDPDGEPEVEPEDGGV